MCGGARRSRSASISICSSPARGGGGGGWVRRRGGAARGGRGGAGRGGAPAHVACVRRLLPVVPARRGRDRRPTPRKGGGGARGDLRARPNRKSSLLNTRPAR